MLEYEMVLMFPIFCFVLYICFTRKRIVVKMCVYTCWEKTKKEGGKVKCDEQQEGNHLFGCSVAAVVVLEHQTLKWKVNIWCDIWLFRKCDMYIRNVT